MKNQILLDLLTIARNDWISNSLGNKIAAADVVDNFRTKEKKGVTRTEPGRRITLEVLDGKPELKYAMNTRLSRFLEHYSNPKNLEHLSVKSSIEDIVNDPTARTVIEYIQTQFDQVESLIEAMGREENNLRLNVVRTEINKTYRSIFGYLDTVQNLLSSEAESAREDEVQAGKDLPLIEVGLGENR